jgi:hypothetical protein
MYVCMYVCMYTCICIEALYKHIANGDSNFYVKTPAGSLETNLEQKMKINYSINRHCPVTTVTHF